MDPARIWAKRKRDDESLTPSMILPGHLADVYSAALRVLDATSDEQITALGLDVHSYRDRHRRIVLLAAALHDLGKANDHFQGMICGTRDIRNNPQGLRHEWVTVLMMQHLRAWLMPSVASREEDLAIVEWAIAGHHPAHNHDSPPTQNPDGSGTEMRLMTGHPDFRSALTWIAQAFELDTPPALSDEVRTLRGPDDVFVHVLKLWSIQGQRLWDRLRRTQDPRLVAAAKSTLIAADVAGSALPREWPNDTDRWEWIGKSFANRPGLGDLQAIVTKRLRGAKPRTFQQTVADSRASVTLVKAGCGTGKTVAAYMWAAANHPTRRLYFCYPTTGTATEGFKDYLFEPEGELGGIGAKLFHSRRDIDLEIILTTGRDTKSTDNEAVDRLAALEAWSTPVVSCTVDTVLGLVQNNRRGLFAWPALAQSAFVFDEIHAYDDRLFGALLRFLRELPGLPVLLMTASLPQSRITALRSTLEKLGHLLKPISGPALLEELPRYRKDTSSHQDLVELIRKTVEDERKILWVGNTVSRVKEAADMVTQFHPLIYHSRFKYEDRVNRHKAVVEGFDRDKNARGTLAICSQVAEISLDLSADLLLTDLAPVPALIQRLGRLNRKANPGDQARTFVVIEPHNHLPYAPADLEAARSWLSRLPDDDLSQRHLADAWEETGNHAPELVPSAWLDGGPVTTVRELREASPGITVLMEQDQSRVKSTPRDLARLVIPMPPPPHSLDWRNWARERGVPIAPTGTIDYDPLRGAEWRK